MFKTITLAALAALTLTACDSKPAEQPAPVDTSVPAPTDVAVDAAPVVDAGAAPVEAIKPPTSDK